MKRGGWFGAPISMLVLALVACGGGDGGAGDLSADDVLSRSAERFEAVKSFHFTLRHENGSTLMPLNLRLVKAEGDVVLPDRLSAEVEAKAGPTTVRVKVVGIADRTWITNPFTRQFQRLPGDASISDVIDPAALVTAVSRSVEGAKIEGSESIDGTDCYRIKGKISSDALVEALSFADTGLTLDVEAWIGKEDLLLRKAKLKGPLLPDEAKDIVREITLSRFDAPVSIEAPQ